MQPNRVSPEMQAALAKLRTATEVRDYNPAQASEILDRALDGKDSKQLVLGSGKFAELIEIKRDGEDRHVRTFVRDSDLRSTDRIAYLKAHVGSEQQGVGLFTHMHSIERHGKGFKITDISDGTTTFVSRSGKEIIRGVVGDQVRIFDYNISPNRFQNTARMTFRNGEYADAVRFVKGETRGRDAYLNTHLYSTALSKLDLIIGGRADEIAHANSEIESARRIDANPLDQSFSPSLRANLSIEVSPADRIEYVQALLADQRKASVIVDGPEGTSHSLSITKIGSGYSVQHKIQQGDNEPMELGAYLLNANDVIDRATRTHALNVSIDDLIKYKKLQS